MAIELSAAGTTRRRTLRTLLAAFVTGRVRRARTSEEKGFHDPEEGRRFARQVEAWRSSFRREGPWT